MEMYVELGAEHLGVATSREHRLSLTCANVSSRDWCNRAGQGTANALSRFFHPSNDVVISTQT